MLRLWLILFSAVFAWSAVAPYDRLTWVLEMLPAAAVFLALLATRRRFAVTPLCLGVLLVLCLLILVGAHYSFARVPPFEGLRHWTGGGRNEFDKFAHFFQGFSPALLFREILLRSRALADRRWLAPLVLASCLALSAAYELLEWLAALLLGGRAEAFLAIQGDPFDAQSDMAMALAGASLALALLGRLHDRQVARLKAF
jgi:putative membrane protein